MRKCGRRGGKERLFQAEAWPGRLRRAGLGLGRGRGSRRGLWPGGGSVMAVWVIACFRALSCLSHQKQTLLVRRASLAQEHLLGSSHKQLICVPKYLRWEQTVENSGKHFPGRPAVQGFERCEGPGVYCPASGWLRDSGNHFSLWKQGSGVSRNSENGSLCW